MEKNLLAHEGDAKDAGLIAGFGRSLREGNGNLLQYPCLEDPVDRGVWQTTVHEVTNSGLICVHPNLHTHTQTRKFKHETVNPRYILQLV